MAFERDEEKIIYKDAPPEIAEAIELSRPITDFLPPQES